MERRNFLKLGGAVGLASAATSGACLPALMPPRISKSELAELLAEMDGGLDRVSRYDMLSDFSRATGVPDRHSPEDRQLARLSMRTMYTSAMFRSLPEEAQATPAVQERVFTQLPEMDEAVFGMADRMASPTAEEKDGVHRRLQKDPTLTERMSETFDRGMGRLRM